MIDLKRTYIFASIIAAIGLIIYALFFMDLLIFFAIPVIVGFINYYFLIRIKNYENFNHLTVLGTLFLRFIGYGVVVFLLIFLNKESENLILIGVSIAIGFSVIQVSTLLNSMTKRKGVK